MFPLWKGCWWLWRQGGGEGNVRLMRGYCSKGIKYEPFVTGSDMTVSVCPKFEFWSALCYILFLPQLQSC